MSILTPTAIRDSPAANSYRGETSVKKKSIYTGIIAVSCIVAATPLLAEDKAMPRQLSIFVGAGAGSGIELNARLLARHMSQQLAGNPTITVQSMPGAGGARAAAYMANNAPKST